jgi:hypothetical protein
LNIFDRELSWRVPDKAISTASLMRLTDYRAEDKHILSVVVFAGAGSEYHLRQCWQKRPFPGIRVFSMQHF